jgi:phosphatidylserine/phosphatidylglycerophosphate/cardiolipin synthase-like enzyme
VTDLGSTVDKYQQLEELNLALNLRIAELRQHLAEAESRAVQLYVTLDDATNVRLLPVRDYDGQIRDELMNLARQSHAHLRVAIPYVTRGGYRDLTALTTFALETGARASVMFRRPDSGVDVRIHKSFNSDFKRQIEIGKLRVRYMGQEGRNGLHAKVVISDSREALVSSANLTGYALTSNVEVGLATRSTRIVHALTVWFDTVFEQAYTLDAVLAHNGAR